MEKEFKCSAAYKVKQSEEKYKKKKKILKTYNNKLKFNFNVSQNRLTS